MIGQRCPKLDNSFSLLLSSLLFTAALAEQCLFCSGGSSKCFVVDQTRLKGLIYHIISIPRRIKSACIHSKTKRVELGFSFPEPSSPLETNECFHIAYQ